MNSNKHRMIVNPYSNKSRKRPRSSQQQLQEPGQPIPTPKFSTINTNDEEKQNRNDTNERRNQQQPQPHTAKRTMQSTSSYSSAAAAAKESSKPSAAAPLRRPISPPLTYNPYSKSSSSRMMKQQQQPISPNTTNNTNNTKLTSPTRSISPPLTYNPYSKANNRKKPTAMPPSINNNMTSTTTGTQATTTTPAILHKPIPKRNHPRANAAASTTKNKTINTSSVSQDASALIISASDKAGMEGIDRSQIDAIILRESGNSLYMQQQKRRDSKVNERIAQMQAQKEEIIIASSSSSNSSNSASSSLERQLQSWQAACPTRSTKVVVDMDMFYMACELLTKPHLAQVPACVGNGMILTSNYLARQYGVRSAMAGYIADKLVDELSHGMERLYHVPSHFQLYKENSLQVKEVLREYDPHLKSYSLDEAYLDLGPYLALYLEHCYHRHSNHQDDQVDNRLLFESEPELNDIAGASRVSTVDGNLGTMSLSDDLHRSIRDALRGRVTTDKTEDTAAGETKDENVPPPQKEKPSCEKQDTSATDEEAEDDDDDGMEDMEQVVDEMEIEGDPKDATNKEEIRCRLRHQDYMKVLKMYSVDICNHGIQTVVHHMRAQVKIRTGGLTCSAGMAPHSGLAKMASDINKPNGQLLVDPHKVLEFLHPLAVRKVPGIGRVTQKILQHVLQVETVQDLYQQRVLVQQLFKKASANYLLKASVGHIGTSSSTASNGNSFASFGTISEEVNDDIDHQKGMSRERTFRPESNYQTLQAKLDSIADTLSNDMMRKRVKAHTITVKVKLSTFDVFSRAKSLDRNVYIQDAEELKVVAKELFASIKAELASKHAKGGKKDDDGTHGNAESHELCCRLLGIRCSSLVHEDVLPQQKPMDKFLTRTANNKPSASTNKKVEHGQEDQKTSGNETSREKDNIISSDTSSAKDPPVEQEESNTCPLCNTTIIGDNDALNRHIDTCLNASTVRQVVREVTQYTQEESSMTTMVDSKKKASQKQKLTDFW